MQNSHSREAILGMRYTDVSGISKQMNSELDQIKKSYQSNAYSLTSQGQIQDKHNMTQVS